VRVLAIIPARYNSSRFPGKPLADIMGASMIQRVYNQVDLCRDVSKIIIATDDERIAFHVKGFGGNVMMTSKHHESGTDRCGEVIEKLKDHFDVVVNIQGDEPFIEPMQIQKLISLFENEEVEIATLAKKITDYFIYKDVNKVKAIINKTNFATNFVRNGDVSEEIFLENDYFKHIGIYAFKQNILEEIIQLPPSKNEKKLKLEQLRWLDNNYKIKIGITEFDPLSVDNSEDIEKIIEFHSKNV
jgi:3-deoxy-manno-octulosonate cytidylyltransferase (CMP-KDO synthetase)